jgi:hypothetical protein
MASEPSKRAAADESLMAGSIGGSLEMWDVDGEMGHV